MKLTGNSGFSRFSKDMQGMNYFLHYLHAASALMVISIYLINFIRYTLITVIILDLLLKFCVNFRNKIPTETITWKVFQITKTAELLNTYDEVKLRKLKNEDAFARIPKKLHPNLTWFL